MSYEMIKKEVQDSIILDVSVCSIAGNLDLQMKLDLDLVYQRVKSLLWNKGGWAARGWLSLLIHISTWDSGVKLHSWAPDALGKLSSLQHDPPDLIPSLRHPAYERCAKTHAGYFVWFSQMPAPKITPKGGKTWPYGILQSRLLVGAGENGAHQSTLRVHCHLGNIRWKGETEPFTTCAADSCGSPITSAGPALKTTGRPAPRLC